MNVVREQLWVGQVGQGGQGGWGAKSSVSQSCESESVETKGNKVGNLASPSCLKEREKHSLVKLARSSIGESRRGGQAETAAVWAPAGGNDQFSVRIQFNSIQNKRRLRSLLKPAFWEKPTIQLLIQPVLQWIPGVPGFNKNRLDSSSKSSEAKLHEVGGDRFIHSFIHSDRKSVSQSELCASEVGLGCFWAKLWKKKWFWVVEGLSGLGKQNGHNGVEEYSSRISCLPAVPVCGGEVIASEIHLGRKVSRSIGACGVKVVDSAELGY